jgi:hypothetical protein
MWMFRTGKFSAAAIVLAATALTGCATAKTAKETTTSSTTPPVTQPVSWEGRLLTLADVGADWKVGQPLNEADYADFAQSPCDASTLDPAVDARLLPTGGIQFEPSDQAYRHLIEFALSGYPDQLAADLDSLTKTILACSPGPSMTTATLLSVASLSVGSIGDQRSAFVLDGKESASATGVWHVRTAMVRVGDRAIGIALTEILDSGAKPAIDDDAFRALVAKAVARLG